MAAALKRNTQNTFVHTCTWDVHLKLPNHWQKLFCKMWRVRTIDRSMNDEDQGGRDKLGAYIYPTCSIPSYPIGSRPVLPPSPFPPRSVTSRAWCLTARHALCSHFQVTSRSLPSHLYLPYGCSYSRYRSHQWPVSHTSHRAELFGAIRGPRPSADGPGHTRMAWDPSKINKTKNYLRN